MKSSLVEVGVAANVSSVNTVWSQSCASASPGGVRSAGGGNVSCGYFTLKKVSPALGLYARRLSDRSRLELVPEGTRTSAPHGASGAVPADWAGELDVSKPPSR